MRHSHLVLVFSMLMACADENRQSQATPAPTPTSPPLAVKQLRQFPVSESAEFWGASISPDGTALLLTDNGSGIRIYDLSTLKLRRSFPTYISVTAVAISPKGTHALMNGELGDEQGPILLDMTTGMPSRAFQGQKAAITCVAFTSDGANILAGAEDVRIWNAETGKEVQRHLLGESEQVLAATSIEGHPVAAVVRQPQEHRFDTRVRVLDLDNKKDLHAFSGPSCNQIDSVALVPEAHLVLLLYYRLIPSLGGLGPPGNHYFLQVRRLSDGKEVFDAELGYAANRIAVYPDGRRFLLAGRNVHEWQLRDK